MKNNNTFLEQQAAFKTGQLQGEAAEQFALQSLRKALIYATNPDEAEETAYEIFMLEKTEQQRRVKAITRRRVAYSVMGIAASFLLIVGLWPAQTVEQTPQKQWQSFVSDNRKMGLEPTSEDNLKEATMRYNDKKYAEAAPRFKDFIEKNPKTDKALPYIYLAECYAKETPPNYKEAIVNLEIARQKDSLYFDSQEELVWNLGFAYSMMDKKIKRK